MRKTKRASAKKWLAMLLSCMMLVGAVAQSGGLAAMAMAINLPDLDEFVAINTDLPQAIAETDFTGYTPISTKQELDAVRNDLAGKYYLTADIIFDTADFEKGGAFYNGSHGWQPIGKDKNNAFTGIFDGNGHTITGLVMDLNAADTMYAGLFGCNQGTVQNLGMIDGNIVANASATIYAGGIVGYSGGTINNCYNTGSVSATSSSNSYNSDSYIGGIVGYSYYGTISNCYNTGNVNATSSYAGGIVGDNYFGTISNCYNMGNVSATSSYDGGIAGYNGSGTVINCYYLDIIEQGVGGGTDTAVRCSNEELQQQSTFSGFDFDAVWELRADNPYPYPTLRTLPHIEIVREENTTEFAGGTGTPYNPYLISNTAHLNNVRNYLDAHYKMTDDIVFTEEDFAEGGAFYNDGQGWQPIGVDVNNAFTGVFDGNGHTITGLFMDLNAADTVYAGMFGVNRGIIRNLGMLNSSISATSSHAGGIAGYNSEGTISNCYNTGNVSATSAAGIVWYNHSGTISNCYNTGSVSATSSYAGGIVGDNYFGTISNCYNTGNVSATSSYASGIAGVNNYGNISSCYNTGNVGATSTSTSAYCWSYSGGIAGYNNEGTISNCYNTGNVGATSTSTSAYCWSYSGGIAGFNDHDNISNCYNTGSVSATSSSNSYNSDSYTGGIVGCSYYGTISSCYNTGSVTASSYAGGIAGYNSSGMVINCYYLDIIEQGVGDGTDTAISYTDEEMQQQSTFWGFDFDEVWTMDGNSYYPYPELRALPHVFDVVPGDMNGDGAVNALDLTALRNCLLTDSHPAAADVNGDSVVDIRDLIALKKMLTQLDTAI